MKTKISEERLISIATGESQPTPNEQILLNEDHVSRELLDSYKVLFEDIKDIPGEELLSPVEMQSIAPGVREKIANRPFWLGLFDFMPVVGARGWSFAGAVATIFLFVLLPGMQMNTQSPGMDLDQAVYLGLSSTEVYYSGDDSDSEFPMLSGIEDENTLASLEEAADSMYDYDSNTIYTQVAQMDAGDFESLTAELKEALSVEVRS